jgi:hypothetical protein
VRHSRFTIACCHGTTVERNITKDVESSTRGRLGPLHDGAGPYLPSDLVTAVIALVAFAQPA